ncbi:MAG: relaxase/mobilization nuclease domain-containing protein [Eubacteriales bacterium]|nr:relaxase/mobilization nuclease domain-containing protein [Eubacteriales bacterium]
MATTKLWHIKGRIKDLIEYVENPEKTVVTDKAAEDFFNVFSYTWNPVKTEGGQYVTSINCQKDIALRQMILTKQQYGKDDGYIAWHGYQSFKPGEVTPNQCHAIGVAFAKEMWGDRFQIVVTTHLDKGHLHNHIAFNSVSFKDGSKYNFSKAEQKRMREVSDRLCRERGLSVIEHPHKAPSRPVWLDEKSGKPTRYNIYRQDIEAAIRGTHSIEDFEAFLNRLGYLTDFTGAHWKLRLPQFEHFTRTDTLDPEWTPEYLRRSVIWNQRFGTRMPEFREPRDVPEEFKAAYIPHQRPTQLKRFYLYYYCELGILPKGTSYTPLSPFMREELRKLDELDRQTRYLAKYNINTIEGLWADREKNQAELDTLTAQRTKLQNRIRRAAPEEKELLRAEKAEVSAKIRDLRLRIQCADGIEERSIRMQENLDRMNDNERRAERQEITRNTIKNERGYDR